ncbi:MAG: outer membrane beta-barrel protein [Verrucomicrobiales bacterium]|nr:outer membrane beta-barrel protein [Verrucomicrobiales bacterium]
MPSVDDSKSLACKRDTPRGHFAAAADPRFDRCKAALRGLASASLLLGWEGRAEFDAEKYLVYDFGKITLRPQLEVVETYDTNVRFNETDPIADLVTTVRPTLLGIYGDRTASYVSLKYSLDGTFYADNDQLNDLGHTITHQSRFRFSKLTIEGTDRFNTSRSLLGGTFSYIDERIGILTLSDQWRADYEISPKTVLGIKGLFDLADYDADDLAQASPSPSQPVHLYDYMSYGGGVRFGYRPSEKITLYPEATAGISSLERNNTLAREAPDLNYYNFVIGAEGDFTPKLTGIVSGGYEIREYADGTDVPDGWVANLLMQWRPRAKTSLSVGYRHWIEVSREALGYIYNAHRPTVSIRQEFGTQGRWTAMLDGYYQIDDYDREVRDFGRDPSGPLVKRVDHLGGIGARLAYRWQPWFTVTAGYDFLMYEDNLAAVPNYEVHRFSLRLLAGY